MDNNKERFIDELIQLLKIPSISADPAYKEEVLRTANQVADYLTRAGADLAEVCSTDGHPIVYAEKILDPERPTILIYGHYDVQPPDPLELWGWDF